VVPVQDTQALMDFVFVATAVVGDPAPELFEAVVAAVEVLVAVAVLAAVVAVVELAVVDPVVVLAAVVPVVVVAEVRVMLPLTEPVVLPAAVVVAVVLPVVEAAVDAAVAAPVVALVPLEELSSELPQPASARDMDNAQGTISRFADVCTSWKISFDNFAINPISTIPRGHVQREVKATAIKSCEHLYVIRDKAPTIFLYAVTLSHAYIMVKGICTFSVQLKYPRRPPITRRTGFIFSARNTS
jgi:hypothetical protein